jgi:hypothetical protein
MVRNCSIYSLSLINIILGRNMILVALTLKMLEKYRIKKMLKYCSEMHGIKTLPLEFKLTN